MVKSAGAGIAAHFTKTLWPTIAFRVISLVTLVLWMCHRFWPVRIAAKAANQDRLGGNL
jgi:hypothetical protein